MYYLLPDSAPRDAINHVDNSGMNRGRHVLIEPTQIQGTLVDENEIRCSEFRQYLGIPRYSELEVLFVPTDRANVTLINLENLVRRVIFRATYDQNSSRVKNLLNVLAQEFQVNIHAISENSACFGSEESICWECREIANRNRLPYPQDNTEIVIDFRCKNAERAENRLDKIYDIKIGKSAASRMAGRRPKLPSGNGVAVLDTSGIAVAEVKDRVISILVSVDPQYYSWDRESTYWSKNAEVLEKILRDALPIALSQQVRPEFERIVEDLRPRLAAGMEASIQMIVQSGSSSLENRKRNLQRLIEEGSVSSADFLARYVRIQNEVRQNLAELEILNSDSGNSAVVKKALENILAMPQVIGIGFNRGIEIYTDTIYITYQKVKYRIGAFKITINLSNGSIHFENLAQPSGASHAHPHISRGLGCFGNISDAVAQMMREESLEMLVTVLIQFLESYDSVAPYERIVNFPLAV